MGSDALRALARRVLALAALVLVGCGSVFGLDDYEITGDARCGNALVDLRSDASNCGRCGNACDPDRVCRSGSCACAQDRVTCEGSCVDLASDRGHCGSCGAACPDAASCDGGVCRCDDARLVVCDGGCVDLDSDDDNCGSCKLSCPTASSCSSGACACDDPNLDLCADGCVSLLTDAGNCGTCGAACPSDATCVAGTCACDDPSATVCAGRCSVLSADRNNCGACGTVCATGATCEAGRCVCPAGQEVCANACIDLMTDVQHCGSCEHPCAIANASSVCAAGVCIGNDCDDGWGDCDGDLSLGEAGNGCEISTATDDANCGLCGNACAGDEECSAGTCGCILPSPGAACSPSGCGCAPGENCVFGGDDTWGCVEPGGVTEGGRCDFNDDCAAGLSCYDYTCLSYCSPTQPCAGECFQVGRAGTAVLGWEVCGLTPCEPVPTSGLSSRPSCAAGERCAYGLKTDGERSTLCLYGSPGTAGLGTPCADDYDCQSGLYCMSHHLCGVYCWLDDDTCAAFDGGFSCRSFVNDVIIDGNELGACVPTGSSAGCKEACSTDADCMLVGTFCADTSDGFKCLNDRCQECFDVDQTCFSDSTTCDFDRCEP